LLIEISPSFISSEFESLPHKALKKVVLPDPEGPMIDKNYPDFISPLIPFIIFLGSSPFLTFV